MAAAAAAPIALREAANVSHDRPRALTAVKLGAVVSIARGCYTRRLSAWAERPLPPMTPTTALSPVAPSISFPSCRAAPALTVTSFCCSCKAWASPRLSSPSLPLPVRATSSSVSARPLVTRMSWCVRAVERSSRLQAALAQQQLIVAATAAAELMRPLSCSFRSSWTRQRRRSRSGGPSPPAAPS